MAGKGSVRRPQRKSDDWVEREWERIFKKVKPEPTWREINSPHEPQTGKTKY